MKTHTFPSTSNEGGLGDTFGRQVFRKKKMKKKTIGIFNKLKLKFVIS
jgi:hypothetical protein